ncbi:hypothetical protein ACFL02_07860 [Planctomycetota bacterium]
MRFFSTRDVARVLHISPTKLQRLIWDNQLEPPPKGPNGNFLWGVKDCVRAGWQICGRDVTDEIENQLCV